MAQGSAGRYLGHVKSAFRQPFPSMTTPMKINREARVETAQREPDAARSGVSPNRAGAGAAASPLSVSQLQYRIDRSPRMLAQRRALDAAFGSAAQRQPVGRDDEEPRQVRIAPVAGRAQPDDDDVPPLQGLFEGAAVQRMDGPSDCSGDAGAATAPVSGTSMPSQLKTGIESLSGMDLSDVRVHRNSGKPAQLNALAYAQGNEIHLGPGQEQHLPHEAWHVVQQRQGRVSETVQLAGVGINDEVRLEREADLMGARAALQGTAMGAGKGRHLTSNTPAREHRAGTASHARHAPSFGTAVQAKLKLNGVDYGQTDGGEDGMLVMQAAGRAWDLMLAFLKQRIAETAGDLPAQQELQALEAKIKSEELQYFVQFSKWIDDRLPGEKTYGKHPVFGRKQQNREYDNWVEVARAVTGWVDAKPARKKEKELARQIYGNPVEDAVLNSLVQKVRLKIEALKVTQPVRYLEIVRELAHAVTAVRTLQGHVKQDATRYGHYEKEMEKAADEFKTPELKVKYATKLQILDDPAAYSMRDKIVLLHDITEYFGKHQPWNPVTAGQGLIPVDNERDALVTTEIDAAGERILSESAMTKDKDKNKLARGMGKTTASRDESAPSTKLARRLNLPVWAGQSMTTVRMLNMAQWAGGKVHEMNALVQGIFAFWRLEYNHTSDFAYHTLHEVMDMAKNFGVAYKMHPREGMKFDEMNEGFVRPAVENLIFAMNTGYASLASQIAVNNWMSQEFKQQAQSNLDVMKVRVDLVNDWWTKFDFKVDANVCRQGLTKVTQGLNLTQLDMLNLDNFVKLKSSTVAVGFWA